MVVVGGGFAGAACAKYIRRWSPTTEVLLVEPNPSFVSCPMSNRVIGGMMSIRDLTRSRDALASGHGVQLVRASVTAIDADAREIRLDDGSVLGYDRLVLAPGIDFMYDTLPGLESQAARAVMPHGWRAGDQTRDLRQRVMSLPEGGVFAMHIPQAPYRCPPGTYERACLVANNI
ncbi:FAD-dependent oxidoreductase, partial [Arthrospira platensis SPKY2]